MERIDATVVDLIGPMGIATLSVNCDTIQVISPGSNWIASSNGFSCDYGGERAIPDFVARLNRDATEVHQANVEVGWWHDLHTGERLDRNVGELLMLVVSELVEANDGARDDLMDDKLPHRRMLEVEIADAKIRILDIAGSREFDISGAAHDLIMLTGPLEWHWPLISSGLMQVVGALVHAMEGHRKHAPHVLLSDRLAFEVGLAEALLRLHGFATAHGLDLDGAVADKREFNRGRLDHQRATRLAQGGKAY